MIIIRNNFIPFKGYLAINLFGILFCRKTAVIDDVTINHESIHSRQMPELLYIPYYIWYGIEYLIRLLVLRNHKKAYRSISFEQEAYEHETDMEYLHDRKWYAWLKYLKVGKS